MFFFVYILYVHVLPITIEDIGIVCMPMMGGFWEGGVWGVWGLQKKRKKKKEWMIYIYKRIDIDRGEENGAVFSFSFFF